MNRRQFIGTLALGGSIGRAAAQPPPAPVIELSLENGKLVSGSNTVRVRRGQQVQLQWSTDRPIDLHLHGYDIEVKASPGSTTTMAFTATIPGRFAVSEHERGKAHAHKAVIYIEVHP